MYAGGIIMLDLWHFTGSQRNSLKARQHFAILSFKYETKDSKSMC